MILEKKYITDFYPNHILNKEIGLIFPVILEIKCQVQGDKNMEKDKYKAMETLIFNSRVNRDADRSDKYLMKDLKLRFKMAYDDLDKLKVPMWKQNNIAYLAVETNWYMSKIIDLTYYAKKPLNVTKLIKEDRR
jgi:cadmium resistance protein CadD (predicted permease)